ncbi:hypothetical protein P6U16_08010 [Rhizobium sp. 32-5/1]|uniref:hypothetical protein n=1 Tax=Rhizobium sp. 32-5/1 TaxID=3019602 RepID=UPI00240E7612|nr:hypothetical protein [Rhizobium sp. 32-5/1]WEZ84519.1 hypothetical protein P6U16_08010 [Rhizobium sp. 32-5/1]
MLFQTKFVRLHEKTKCRAFCVKNAQRARFLVKAGTKISKNRSIRLEKLNYASCFAYFASPALMSGVQELGSLAAAPKTLKSTLGDELARAMHVSLQPLAAGHGSGFPGAAHHQPMRGLK